MLIHRDNFLLLFLLSLWISACAPADDTTTTTTKDYPVVVATTGMIADLIQNIGGDSVQVTALMGPGVDPHLYKATQGDLTRLQQADLIFYNGYHLEGKMGEVLEKFARLKPVVALAEAVPADRIITDESFASAHDPHIWFDVSLWAATIDAAVAAMSKQAPQHRDYYQQRAANYRRQLDSLHERVKVDLASIPAEQRVLITAHDAFSYFGRAYGLEVRGLQGISTLSEFGLKDRVELVDFIVARQIKAVFVETSVSQKNIAAIVEGVRQRGHEVRIGGSLYSDALGATDGPAGTYLGMVTTNVANIVNALK